MVAIPGLENINLFPIFGQIMYYVKIALIAGIIFGGIILLVHVLSFRIKAIEIRLAGDGRRGYSISKIKSNRFRWNKQKSSWRCLLPLFNKQQINPFDSNLMYTGNKVLAFKIGNEFIPGEIVLEKIDDKFIGSMKPIPYHLRNWQSVQEKINSVEFSKHNFWEDNKTLLYGLITVVVCCGVALGTVYMTYKFAGAGTQAMSNLADSLRNFGTNVIK